MDDEPNGNGGFDEEVLRKICAGNVLRNKVLQSGAIHAMQNVGRRRAFGPFEIQPATGELWRSGRSVRLAPQPFAVLALLVDRCGDLVTREELHATLWPDGTTVEFDQGLNYCIRQIRIALQDNGRTPSYVGTIPKRGYRLLVPVTQKEPQRTEPPARRAAPRRWVPMASAAATVALAIGLWMHHGQATPALPAAERARQMFLEAEYLSGTWELDKVNEAKARYVAVASLEPEFPGAWAGLANTDVILFFVGTRPAEALADSEIHARRALELDSSLAAAHAALGHSYWHQWRWREADEELRQAVAGRGNRAVAHQLYGLYLAAAGRPAEAVRHAREAVDLAPTSGLLSFSLAQVYLETGHFDLARTQALRTLDIDRHFPLAYNTLLRANVLLGRMDEAAQTLEDKARHFPKSSDFDPWKAYLLARRGRLADAHDMLDAGTRPGQRKSLGYAAALVAIGDNESAIAALEESVAAHVPSLIWLTVAPELAPLRSDARFASLEARLRGQ